MSTATMQRRALDFRDFDALLNDIAELQKRGYRRLGQWDLSQILEHVGQGIEACLHGFPHQGSWFIRRLIGPIILKSILKKRHMDDGIKVPKWWLPGPAHDERQSVERFRKQVEDFKAFRGTPKQHPFFGPLPRETWEQLVLVHAAHHLSFLQPNPRK
ncbi:MAG: DUF1569 domain-containing protein [Planctomycetota bacterium]